MNDAPPVRQATGPLRNRWRYGVLAAIILGAAGACAWAQLAPDLNQQLRFLITAPTIAGATLLSIFWLLATADWKLSTRMLSIGACVLTGIAIWQTVRIDTTSGDVVPMRVSWRWSAKPDEKLGEEFTDAVGGPADLSATTPDDSPQFLGPGRVANVPGPKLQRDWLAHPPRELWRRPIGAGWGSFAIVGNYVVTQEQRGGDELVVCYELPTGKPVWHHADPVRYDMAPAGVGPRATPTVDSGRVYTVGAKGTFNCLDGATGSRLWGHDMLVENDALLPDGTMRLNWGNACSPLIVGDVVVVSPGGPDGRSLVGYDKVSGAELWHAGDDQPSYASPQLATLAGKEQIVVFNQLSIVGHDPADGHILWRYEWDGTESKCSQPLVIDDYMVVVSAGYGRGSAALHVTRDEAGEFHAEEVWTARNTKSLKCKFANMILHDGFIYALDDGVLAAIEVTTGKRRWRAGRYGHGQLLEVGELLLVQAESGELVLVEPNTKALNELGRIEALHGTTWNNPAIAGRHLLVRNAEEAVCYELPLAE